MSTVRWRFWYHLDDLGHRLHLPRRLQWRLCNKLDATLDPTLKQGRQS